MTKLKRMIGCANSYEIIELFARDGTINQVERHTQVILKKWGSDVNCFNFHLELKAKFPRAKAWGNPDHWITEIDGMLFDKTGLLFTQYETTDKAFKKAFRMPPVNDF